MGIEKLKKLAVMVVGLLLVACSDDDGEKKLSEPPPILLATEITATSFVANWASVSGATSYKLQVSENISFSAIVSGYNDLEVTTTNFKVEGLDEAKKYFYRVKAVNSNGETDYSQVAAGRKINKELVYNILWKGDEIRSQVNFDFMDLTFNSNGDFTGSLSGNVASTGTWQWINDDDNLRVQSSTGTFEILFLDVTDTEFVAYFSTLTYELAYFEK